MAGIITISHITSTSPKYGEVWQLREDVLRKPLGLSLRNEDLSRDHTDTIMIAELEGRVVGCLILTDKGDGVVQLRQMAVAADRQGHGIGRQLVEEAEKLSAERGFRTMMMHARKVALGFYTSMLYATHGDEFLEVGIPHYHMEKALR